MDIRERSEGDGGTDALRVVRGAEHEDRETRVGAQCLGRGAQAGDREVRIGYNCPPVYMTVHQQDSSQPQQSHDSPHFGAGEGLMIVETEEATLAGIVMVFVGK